MMAPSWGQKKAGLSHCMPEVRTFFGAEAQKEISRRLSGFPLAQKLSREVYDFYGDHLTFTESKNFSSALFTVRLQHQPVALKSAEIQLQLGMDRAAEALAHELLHLRLFILGFPLGEIVYIPSPFADYARYFIGMCHWVLNLVHHEMNYEAFVALGFNKSHFLGRSNGVIDYQKGLSPDFHSGFSVYIDFPRWCIEYLRHFLSARHGGDGDSLDQAKDAVNWGSRVYPNLRQVAAEMRKWFEIGAFRDPSQYSSQVNFLLGLMGIPNFTGWAGLELSDYKKTIAFRLDR